MPKVSVIVPVYNSSKFLRDCLDSLVNQTLKDIEIITIDDCSTDNSLDILNEYKAKYDNIIVIQSKKNGGQSVARNKGLDVARGEYIGFVDSDDIIEPYMYERMYKAAINNNHMDIVTTNMTFIKSDYKEKDKEPLYDSKPRLIDYAKNPLDIIWDSPAVWNKIYKRKLINDYRFLDNCMWEDCAFTYTMLMKAKKALFIDSNLYMYRKDINVGISRRGYDINSPLDDTFRIGDELKNQAIKNKVYNQFKEAIKYLQMIVCFQRLKEIDEWKEPKEIKDKYKEYLYKKTISKYGSLEDIDMCLLSGRVKVDLLEEVENKVNEKSDLSKFRI